MEKHWKTLDIRKVTVIRKCDDRRNKEQQPKLTFNGIHKSYTSYGSYTIKQREVPMDEPIYVGFAVSQWSRLLMYETQCDKFLTY